MKIVFDASVDDHVALNLYTYTHLPAYGRDRIIWGILFPAGLFLFLAVLNFNKSGWSSVAFAAIIPGLYALWFLGGRKGRLRRSTRKILEEDRSKAELGPQEIEVAHDGIVGRTRFEESKLSWKAIERTVSTPDYYFIYLSLLKAIVIPKNKITEGDFETFKRAVEERLREEALTDGVALDEGRLIVDDKAVNLNSPEHKSCLCGVISLVGGLSSVILYGVVVGISIAARLYGQDAPSVEDHATEGLLILTAIVANLLGTIFGISGLIKSNQKKLLPIIGLVINCGIILLIGMLLTVGILFG
jgi:hypothetical protein